MASNQEIPIGDDDLDALMQQLEEETSGLVAAPVVTAVTTPKPIVAATTEEVLASVAKATSIIGMSDGGGVAVSATPAGDDGLDDLEKELAAELGAPVTTPAPVSLPAPVDDMAELEAQLSDPEPVPLKPELQAKLDALADDAPFEPSADAGKVEQSDVDAEMASLEAELSGAAPATPAEPVVKAAAIKEASAVIEEKPAPAPEEPAHPNPKRVPTLDFHIDVDEFRSDTRVSETNLDNCFMEQAGLIAHYVKQLALSEAQAARVKLQVEIAEAKLYDQHRKALAGGTDKVTEKMVENAVRTDPKYAAIHVRLIDAESIAAVNKGLVESLKQRRDMLIQLGADRREDGKGTARILAAQANDANTAARAMAAAKKVGS